MKITLLSGLVVMIFLLALILKEEKLSNKVEMMILDKTIAANCWQMNESYEAVQNCLDDNSSY